MFSIKNVLRRTRELFRRLAIHYRNVLNYKLPNRSTIWKNNVSIKRPYFFLQKTYCLGEGKVEIGEHCIFGYKLGGFHRGGSIEIQARYKNSKICIGKNVATNNNVFICAANKIEIGDFARIGQNVTIMDFEAHGIDPDKRNKIGEIGEVMLGNNIWIGNNVIILKNTVIGENSIVAAGAVVSGKFPSNVIIGGVPARIIKNL